MALKKCGSADIAPRVADVSPMWNHVEQYLYLRLFVGQAASAAKHIGMSLRVKQTDSHWAIAPVLDERRAIGKPGLEPNG